MKWIKRILLGLVLIVVLAVGVIFAWGGHIINREYTAEPRNILTSARPEIMTRGKRLSQVFGCLHGCHGEDMEGEVFFEGWAIGKIISPNLTAAMEKYTRSELEAIIRQGIRPGGKSVLAMPSASFAVMTDRDLSAILSFISGYPRQELDLGRSRYGLLPRLLLITGEFEPAAAEVNSAPWQSDVLSDTLKLGEYLARNACSECHGMDFEGQGEFTPPLAIARGYSPAEFRELLSTGVGLGDRDLGLMSVVAKYRFSKMTDAEMKALHQYLNSL